MTLVQSPGLVDRDIGLLDDIQDRAEGDLGAGQERGVSDVELVSGILKCVTSVLGLLHTLLAQVGVEPSAEPVLLVPLGLAVTDHDNLVCGHLEGVVNES